MSRSDAGSARRSWRVWNLVLLGLAALLAATLGLLAPGVLAPPADHRAATASRQHDEVVSAAVAETEAFLTVDHTDMDPLIDRVLEGATGAFEREYRRSSPALKVSTRQSGARSSTTVVRAGVSSLDDDAAVVLVAADSQVSNRSTDGRPQPRYYRLRLTMERHGETWLTSGLQFVG